MSTDPMPVRPLPENPNLDHLRSQARALQRAVRAGEPAATARVGAAHAVPTFPLSKAQWVVAREYGFASWPRLRHFLNAVAEHGWSSTSDDGSDPPADAFCRLACLTYTAADGPDRWRAARSRFTPELVAGHVWAAATAADLSTVERLVTADPSLATRRGGPHGWRPLCYLAYSRLDGMSEPAVLGTARVLLDAGADPNEGYLWDGLPYLFTLLTGVFGEGEQGPTRQPRHPYATSLARLLLEAGADPNDGQTLYNRMFASGNDHLELLFEYGLGRGDGGVWRARVGEQLDTPAGMLRGQLRWAVEHDQLDRVRLLVQHGVDILTPYNDGRTAGQLANLAGATGIADLLVAHGADPGGLAPVDQFVAAALRTDRAAIDRLRAAHPDVVEQARNSRPGLVVWAAARGGPGPVTLLVELGFDVNARGRSDVPVEQEWETALHHAAGAGHLGLAQLLLGLGADPRLVDARFNATPLDWARHLDHPELVRLLEPSTVENQPSTVEEDATSAGDGG